MGFHKMRPVVVNDGQHMPKPLSLSPPYKMTGKLDGKAWRRKLPRRRHANFFGLAMVAIAGCAAGYFLMMKPAPAVDSASSYQTYN